MSVVMTTGFYGCCGATVFYLQATSSEATILDLKNQLQSYKGKSGLGVAVLTEAQHNNLFADMKKMGWTKFKTPVRNPNTNTPLHLYMININEFGSVKSKVKGMF